MTLPAEYWADARRNVVPFLDSVTKYAGWAPANLIPVSSVDTRLFCVPATTLMLPYRMPARECGQAQRFHNLPLVMSSLDDQPACLFLTCSQPNAEVVY